MWSLRIEDLNLDSVRKLFIKQHEFFEFRISELNTDSWSFMVAVTSQVNT